MKNDYMKKLLVFVMLMMLLPGVNFGQRQTAKKIVPETTLALNEGIYLSVSEFLNNEPSIPYPFQVINCGPDYYLYPEERNCYFLTYTDNMGYRKTLSIDEVWGYYNGNGIFLTYRGRPYELLQLGAISICRYHQQYNRNIIAQAFSLYSMGSSVTSADKTQDVLFHLKNDTIIIPTMKSFQRLISDDPEIYREYKKDRKTDYAVKPLVYLQKYNEKHPVRVTSKGIWFEETMPATTDIIPAE